MRVLLRTERLELVALEADLARAALSDRPRFAQMLDAVVPEEWPLTDLREALPLFASFADGEAFGGVVVHRNRRVVVGDAGFHGTPIQGGDAEIGYSLVIEARGHGYATEIVAALLRLGWEEGLQEIVARVELRNEPSHRVLRRNGFHSSGESDGYTVWRLERPVTSA
ncbi:hypothetical protein BH11ARM2_BH11ARM2_20300 [soil metagenome]